MEHRRQLLVEAVARLVLNGVWYSDAMEIAFIIFDSENSQSILKETLHFPVINTTFEEDVQEYIHDTGKKVPTPTYRNIF
jgi:hypothetical protein